MPLCSCPAPRPLIYTTRAIGRSGSSEWPILAGRAVRPWKGIGRERATPTSRNQEPIAPKPKRPIGICANGWANRKPQQNFSHPPSPGRGAHARANGRNGRNAPFRWLLRARDCRVAVRAAPLAHVVVRALRPAAPSRGVELAAHSPRGGVAGPAAAPVLPKVAAAVDTAAAAAAAAAMSSSPNCGCHRA